jgi:trigger factor
MPTPTPTPTLAATPQPTPTPQITPTPAPATPNSWLGSNGGVFSFDEPLNYSEGLDDNGFWLGVTALNYVSNLNPHGLAVPRITDNDVQNVINDFLFYFANEVIILNRAVQAGDEVNIDFVGSVDGAEFDGGSTNGWGTYVIAGCQVSYIDNFLDQIIGHMPGSVVNVEVTFPNNYHDISLRGKRALFVTAINYIIDFEPPELTDQFVLESLHQFFGWSTIAEMKNGVFEDMQYDFIMNNIERILMDSVTIKSVPNIIIESRERMLMDEIRNIALSNGIEPELYINLYFGGTEGLLSAYREQLNYEASFFLVIQAIAEYIGLTITDNDTEEFVGFVYIYGLPYIKNYVLMETVMYYVIDNIVLGAY